MRPWQRLILIEQYGAGTFMVPQGASPAVLLAGGTCMLPMPGLLPQFRRFPAAAELAASRRAQLPDHLPHVPPACWAGRFDCERPPAPRPPADMEQFTESNRTLAIVKHVLVDPPEGQNGPFLEERSHLGVCRPGWALGCWPTGLWADKGAGRGCRQGLRNGRQRVAILELAAPMKANPAGGSAFCQRNAADDRSAHGAARLAVTWPSPLPRPCTACLVHSPALPASMASLPGLLPAAPGCSADGAAG